MAESKPKPEETSVPSVTFTPEQVMQLLLKNNDLEKALLQTQKDNIESNKKLADAILESRKPYVDPKVLEAKQEELKQRQRDIKLEQLRRRETKKQCHHHRVDDQDQMQPKLNIKWMRHSNGIINGVCGRCMSQFDATNNPEDAKLLRQDPTALNQMGRARS
jgi:hypothetical protein